jgi:hypothetical protein
MSPRTPGANRLMISQYSLSAHFIWIVRIAIGRFDDAARNLIQTPLGN